MISHADIVSMVASIGMPYAYHHFAEGEANTPPFIVFLYPESNNFGADGKVYAKFNNLQIELYTSKKDTASEARVEAVLDANDIFYQKSEVYIESEGVYEVLYEMELI